MMKEQLPDFLLADLFTNSIIYIGDDIKKKRPKEDDLPQKSYLGNYGKKIIVLVNDAENVYLDDDNLNFLSGILNACKLNLAHIALLNFNRKPISFEFLKKE